MHDRIIFVDNMSLVAVMIGKFAITGGSNEETPLSVVRATGNNTIKSLREVTSYYRALGGLGDGGDPLL